eukprot:TRINITY_DN21039_c0_g1_i2.p1 TRINITY_DN21039_c0_g1~~TRINITY_DN21039_c0_g1_i2.p1  ORF type:complete len:176 (-),score=51.37 TRINITY_DN21039_c0_g1_i2:305-832(-)
MCIRDSFLSQELTSDDRLVSLQVWDTAGQERFQSLGVAFYRGADVCVLVFDLTSSKSFKALDTWRDEFLVQASPPDPENFPFVVLGNKVDLHQDRQVSTQEAKEYCIARNVVQDGQALFWETSAKNRDQVEAAFSQAAGLAMRCQPAQEQGGALDTSVHLQDNLPTAAPSRKCAC